MNADITVVVPYHNEKETIEYTLERVGEQTLPARFAIFVNSSSSDNTYDVVKEWIQKNQHRFSTVYHNIFEHTSNPGSSKNVGVRHAITEWIAFMDCGQRFGKDWLEKQSRFAAVNNVEIVSGVVHLIGGNWVDRCAVAQTYGFKRDRPCIPTTLVKKTVFERAGMFLEGRRSGYDAAWAIKLDKLGIERSINPEVRIHYIGTNFSSNLNHLLRKVILYSEHSVALEGYWSPYLYMTFPFIFFILPTISYPLALTIAVLYLFCRAVIIPIIKSRNIDIYAEHPVEALVGLCVVGVTIDLGKTIGSIKGMKNFLPTDRGSLQR